MSFRSVGLNKFFNYLLSFTKQQGRLNIPPKVITALGNKTYDILQREPTLLKLRPPMYVVGDIHGQYEDLLRIFQLTGLPPQHNFLFLGDFIDSAIPGYKEKGSSGLQVIRDSITRPLIPGGAMPLII